MARRQDKVGIEGAAENNCEPVLNRSLTAAPPSKDALASRRRRLGTALHELAADLAQERRRTAQLERELARLRSRRPQGSHPTTEDAA